LRGYALEAVGPLTEGKLANGQKVVFNQGGEFTAFTNIELQHPLSREAGLKWVVFFDAGHAGEIDDFKISTDYGFGFRWFSPIGVLRFEFGYPLSGPLKDSGSQFHFDIGQFF